MPKRERIPRLLADLAWLALAFAAARWTLGGGRYALDALTIADGLVVAVFAYYAVWAIFSPETVTLVWGPRYRDLQMGRAQGRRIARLERL